MLDGPAGATEFVRTRLHLWLIRSLEREASHVWERLQALKLTRRIIDVLPQPKTRPSTD